VNDRKRRIEAALNKFATKDLKEIDKLQGTSSKRNTHPERDLVQKPCMIWMRAMKWDVEVYEAKATYDPRAGCYRNQAMKAGTTDCMGTLPNGLSVIVEFKAPGKLATFNQDRNHKQKEFVIKKINTNAFAVVVDSVERLKELYYEWAVIKEVKPSTAIDFLLKALP